MTILPFSTIDASKLTGIYDSITDNLTAHCNVVLGLMSTNEK